MSEPISAFMAYNANGIKKSPGNKKNKSAKKAAKGGTKNVEKMNGTTKAGGKQNGKKIATDEAKITAKPSPSKTTTNKNGTAKAVPNASSTLVPKKSKERKSFVGTICCDDIDNLVEQLMQSPSKKKLSKEEQKKKKQLEAYLLRQLEKDDKKAAAARENEHENDNELSDEHGSCSCPEEASGSETDVNSQGQADSESNSDSQDSQATREFQLPQKTTTANNAENATNKKANKRKSNEALPVEKEANSGNAQAKSVRMEGAQKPQPMEVVGVACNGAVPKRRSKADELQVSAQSTPHNTANRAANIKIEPTTPPSSIIKMNSVTEGLKVFRWLLSPIKVDDFYGKYWERNACLVKRQQASYFKHLISFEAIDQMLLKHHVEFTKNIDLTSYKNGVRETLNPSGRAMPPVVWEHYGRGCSIRLLNPQTFLPALYTLSATMQEYFHCLVGANAYLTPPNSQGFAPHYDDIEAFVLQIEGRKRWKLYKPRSKSEELPRVSSRNFKQNEIGKPILEEVLSPGDILYFPRGTIHQAFTEPGHHSLHITLSVYQKQSYADLFERMVPLMMQRAIESSVELRRGLPLHTWHNAGIAFSDNDTEERQQLVQNVSQMLSKCMRDIPVSEVMDAAVDQLAKKYQHEALPPEILPSERARTIFGSKSTTDERGECICDYEIDLRTNVRLLRANIMRLIHEEHKIRLYYYLNNSKEYCEYEPNYIEINIEDAGSVEVLIKSYPAYVSVSQLPLTDDERKISMVTALWENGLLMLEKPLN